MVDPDLPAVALVAVDEVVLGEMVRVATSDAAADEVTPRLDAAEGWTDDRVTWLRALHRDCREGFDGLAAQATWAVTANGAVVGAVRLKRTDDRGVLETGIWLTRTARGRGIGLAAITAVLAEAERLHAIGVRADTTAHNVAALGVLERLGFTVTVGADDQRTAHLDLSEFRRR